MFNIMLFVTNNTCVNIHVSSVMRKVHRAHCILVNREKIHNQAIMLHEVQSEVKSLVYCISQNITFYIN